jgi:hypothetical protein
MAQKNRANMLTDIVSNIYNNLINFITGQNAQDRFVNLLDSSPNILSDASQANGYVSTDANNEMFSSYYDEEISRADLISDLTANLAVGGKFYRINDAVGNTITLLVIAESNINLYSIGTDITTGEQGTYDITTDVFTVIAGSGNANITTITVAALQDLENGIGGTLSLTTLYITTDSTPYKLMCKAETVSQLSKTATVVDSVYSGTVNFDLQGNTMTVVALSDNGIEPNQYFGVAPITLLAPSSYGNIFYINSDASLGDSCSYNTFEQKANNNILGNNCSLNTFKQYAINFIFGDNLNNVTIDAGVGGTDYTATPDYDFLYNNAYSATIFTDGTDNYHRYYDPANDRIVLRNLSTPLAAPTYIGGGGGASLDLEVNGTPNVDQTLLNLIEGTNIDITDNGTGGVIINSLADRYKTSSTSSITIGNGSRTFTVDANLAYIPLQEVLIVYDPTHHMHGTVTSYSGTTLVVDVNHHTGSGTFASWVINLDGIPIDAITGSGTSNQIAYFTSGQVIASLDTATYPSLTELSYVKGVTSDIQTQLNARLPLAGGSLTGAINEAQGANIASATTTNIGAATGNYVVVTGTTTITSLGTVQAGTRRIVNFSGILILTHNGTSLILPTAANITTAAGDTATFISLGSGNWVCVNYMRASGAALVGGGSSNVTVLASGADGTASSGTSNTISISVLISANTFAVDDVIRINHRVRATGIATTRETRIYVNTTNAIAGAVLVSTASLASTVLSANLQRFLAIKNATTNTEVITTTTNQLTDYNNFSTAVSTLAINWTVDQYIIFAVNALNGADSIRASMYSIEKL